METFEFTIIASGLSPEADDFETRFYEAGCDDATISFQKGHIIVDFARDAETIRDAISSAIDNVRAAGAHVDRIEPDPLVSLSDIAVRAGITRAAVSQYAKGQRAEGFPSPVARVTSESPLWEWPEVARWFYIRHRISGQAVAEAEALCEANAELRERQREFA